MSRGNIFLFLPYTPWRQPWYFAPLHRRGQVLEWLQREEGNSDQLKEETIMGLTYAEITLAKNSELMLPPEQPYIVQTITK